MKDARSKRKVWLTVGSIVVVLLAAATITLGSFSVPVPADQGNAVYILFALSVLIFATFLVFGLILTRSLVRLWAERRTGQMGSRFKVKMVLGAMGVSLLPLVFLFFFSYALVNRTLNLWFPRPLEIANEQSQLLLSRFEQSQSIRLNNLAADLVSRDTGGAISVERSPAFDAYWITDSNGQVTAGSDFKTANVKAPNSQAKAGGVRLRLPPRFQWNFRKPLQAEPKFGAWMAGSISREARHERMAALFILRDCCRTIFPRGTRILIHRRKPTPNRSSTCGPISARS